MTGPTVEFRCDRAGTRVPLPHRWEHTVGSGHAAPALRADWQDQIRRSRADLGFRHVRFHGLLGDDLGTLVEQEKPWLYSFFNADRIWDFFLSIGIRNCSRSAARTGRSTPGFPPEGRRGRPCS